jgi:hypothetical protein
MNRIRDVEDGGLWERVYQYPGISEANLDYYFLHKNTPRLMMA